VAKLNAELETKKKEEEGAKLKIDGDVKK